MFMFEICKIDSNFLTFSEGLLIFSEETDLKISKFLCWLKKDASKPIHNLFY